MISSSTPTRLPSGLCDADTRNKAFSLVEVAIALGIVSFALIALLGLMTASLNSGKRAYEDTTIASLTQRVVTEIKTNTFANLAGLDRDLYFTYDGTPVAGTDGAYYRCRLQSLAHASADLPAAAKNSAHGLRVRLAFFCPPENPKTNEIFETTIAKY